MEILSQLLSDRCKEIKKEKCWTSTSRIIGEAVEDCVITMSCPICNNKALVKYQTNQKSKDVKCEKCSCQIQIKATKHKKQSTSLKLLGAEYKTTCLSIKENNVNYLVVMYSVVGDKYIINDIYFINHTHINESCIIPRKPLSHTAKRAGWQGCMLVFNTFKSVKVLF
jgi:type II restriction enzyme